MITEGSCRFPFNMWKLRYLCLMGEIFEWKSKYLVDLIYLDLSQKFLKILYNSLSTRSCKMQYRLKSTPYSGRNFRGYWTQILKFEILRDSRLEQKRKLWRRGFFVFFFIGIRKASTDRNLGLGLRITRDKTSCLLGVKSSAYWIPCP